MAVEALAALAADVSRYMKTRIFRFFIILAAWLLAQGCAGFSVNYRQTTSIDNPSFSDWASLDGVFEGDAKALYSAQWLEYQWGSPQRVSVNRDGSEEVWTYEFEQQCWSGIVPMVILPVPLIIPTGKEKVVVLIRNDLVVSAKQIKKKNAGVIFWPFTPEGPVLILGTKDYWIFR